MVTFGRSTRTALRMRVNISAMGSVIIVVRVPLPARLFHARNQPSVGQLTEADPADAELTVHRPRAPAYLAAPNQPRRKLRLALGHSDFRFTRHSNSCPLLEDL